jgi:hypothetical protein
MVPGTTDRDYYGGKVTEATAEQKAWAEARTHRDDAGETAAAATGAQR